jgi:hypothetical protein
VRVFHVPARWWRPCSFYGARCHRLFEKKPSIVSQEVPSPTLSPSVKRVGGGPKVNLLPMVVSSFFFLLFSLPVKVQVYPFFFLFFNFNPYVFYCLFLSMTLLKKFFMFSIQFLNYNLSYIVFTNSVVIFLICHFYPWIFC